MWAAACTTQLLTENCCRSLPRRVVWSGGPNAGGTSNRGMRALRGIMWAFEPGGNRAFAADPHTALDHRSRDFGAKLEAAAVAVPHRHATAGCFCLSSIYSILYSKTFGCCFLSSDGSNGPKAVYRKQQSGVDASSFAGFCSHVPLRARCVLNKLPARPQTIHVRQTIPTVRLRSNMHM